ncbi:hypothetical protein [Novosphingobium sp. Fuku2-ISO-50]|uniref:hypothetical protein n=1 Tax=Novosphingobium sp. Fuku2-ISO-50 TaxID=1739114 RepID=UPI00076BF7E4|nr:hypothetical protein [Novosphingobium sp. Fuku2-ISO-50]KUR80303.1 hypothetical protein AQZ50_02025 [Novosphingobium sp. Fuku2-ISO-50]
MSTSDPRLAGHAGLTLNPYHVGMKKLSKKLWLVTHHGKAATMLSGAAMITLDQHARAAFAGFISKGTKRDMAALRGDYLKALGKVHIDHERRERESID